MLTIFSLAYRSTNDVVYLERAKVLFDQAMPDLKDHLARNENLITLMYADGKLDPNDCTDALTEIKVRPNMPVQTMLKQLTCILIGDVAVGVRCHQGHDCPMSHHQIIPRAQSGDSSW
jgi:hypothetical protein